MTRRLDDETSMPDRVDSDVIERNVLLEEITRLVKSPYPSQLHTLRDLLLHAKDTSIQYWAEYQPCQIRILSRIVLTASHTWSETIHIIQRLACVAEVRNILLQEEPHLLDSILIKSLDEQHLTGQYTQAAIPFLYWPLPKDTAIPTSAQAFLLRVFDYVNNEPSTTNIQTLRSILSGAARPILSCLSPETIRSFQNVVLAIIREASTSDQQAPAIHCLAIMAILLNNCTTVTWDASPIKAFFYGPKAPKTISLVVLQVIACGNANTVQDLTMVKSILESALLVIEAMDESIIRTWCHDNKPIVNKVLEKTNGANDTFRMRIMPFLVNLLPASDWSPRLVDLCYNSWLTSSACLISSWETSNLMNVTLITKVQPQTSAFNNLIDLAIEDIDDIQCLNRAIILVEALNQIIRSSRDQCTVDLDATFISQIYRYVQHVQSIKEHVSIANCNAETSIHISYARFNRCLAKSLLLLLSRNANSHRDLYVALLDIVSSPTRQHICPNGTSVTRMNFELPANSPEYQLDFSQPWQDILINAIQRKSESDAKHLVTIVNNICGDLEKRCNDVETPLLDERRKNVDLQQQYDELDDAYGRLESQTMDTDLRLKDLEAQLLLCQKDRDNLKHDTIRLMSNIQELEQQSRSIVKKNNHDFEMLRAEYDKAMAKSSSNEGKLQQEIDEWKVRIDAANSALQDKHKALQELTLKHQQSVEEQAVTREKVNALEQLAPKLAAAEQEIIKRCKLQQAIEGQITDLQAEHAAFKTSADVERSNFIDEYRQSAAEAQREWDEQRMKLEEHIATIEEEHVNAEVDANKAIQSLRDKTAEQQRKIEKLKTECLKKDRQILDAQSMKHKLMSAMGFDNGDHKSIVVVSSTAKESTQTCLPLRNGSFDDQTETVLGSGDEDR